MLPSESLEVLLWYSLKLYSHLKHAHFGAVMLSFLVMPYIFGVILILWVHIARNRYWGKCFLAFWMLAYLLALDSFIQPGQMVKTTREHSCTHREHNLCQLFQSPFKYNSSNTYFAFCPSSKLWMLKLLQAIWGNPPSQICKKTNGEASRFWIWIPAWDIWRGLLLIHSPVTERVFFFTVGLQHFCIQHFVP